MLSFATSSLVLVSIPFLIVVDHKAGTGYAVVPTSERARRDSNVLHTTKSSTSTKFTSSALPQQETSKYPISYLYTPFFSVTRQPLLAAEEEQDGPSTEVSSLLSSVPGDIVDDDSEAVSKKSAHSSTDVTGLALLRRPEFWQLWVLMGLLSGVGLMTIKYVQLYLGTILPLTCLATLAMTCKHSGNSGIRTLLMTSLRTASCGTSL